MSKRPRQPYSGCSLDADPKGALRLRWRTYDADGQPSHRAYGTGLLDTPGNRTALEPLARTIGAFVQRGKDPLPTLNEYFGRAAAAARGTGAPIGHTLASYVRDVFLPYNQAPRVRKAQARDYRRHLRIVVARLGDIPLAGFEPRDIRGLQAELLDRGLSPKYVKNILSGSLRALIAQALDDKALPADPFPRRLKWAKWKPPGADPFTADERTAIVHWFERKRFGLRPRPDFTHTSQVKPPSYHAVHRRRRTRDARVLSDGVGRGPCPGSSAPPPGRAATRAPSRSARSPARSSRDTRTRWPGCCAPPRNQDRSATRARSTPRPPRSCRGQRR